MSLVDCRTARAIALLVLLAAPGCSEPKAAGLRIVPRSSRKEAGLYVVTALLENSSGRRIGLEEITVEMTTFDRDGRVLACGYPFYLKGRLGPFATTRIPLNRPDRDGQVDRASVVLKDSRGRVLSEAEVPR